MNVHEALRAICTTGKGRCWYCDARLPAGDQAIRAGWDVQRLDDHPVPSVILVCPTCLRLKIELGDEEFLRTLPHRLSGVPC